MMQIVQLFLTVTERCFICASFDILENIDNDIIMDDFALKNVCEEALRQ